MAKSRGVVLLGPDKNIEELTRRAKLGLVVADAPDVPFEKTLIVEPGTRVPWDLAPAAWHFLERWDAAVPLWQYQMTADDVGTPEERKATAEVIRDLRVPLHSVELLFVRRNEAGIALVNAWKAELTDGAEKRLAFLRALYRVKPRVCVLPTTWLVEVRRAGQQTAAWSRVRSMNAGQPLVLVELEPGRFVKCHRGDEERVLAHFQRQRGG
jgi:hypothetical protein